MNDIVFVGVDGGATKTEAAVLGGDGTVLSRVRGSGVRIGVRVSKANALIIRNLISKALRKAGAIRKNVAWYGFGLCGYDYPEEYEGQKRSLINHLKIDYENTTLVNDGIIALWGGARSRVAIALQIGTGFTAAYRKKFGEEKPFDEVNCGVEFDIRRRIFTQAFRSWDGRERTSILPALLKEYFGEEDDLRLIRKLRRHKYSREKVGNVLAVLNEGVRRKDALCLRLVEQGAKYYSRDILAIAKRVGAPNVEIVLGGGVLLNGPPMLLKRMSEFIRMKYPKAKVHKAFLPPSVGAAVMAAHFSGAPESRIFNKAKKKRYNIATSKLGE